MMDKTKTIANTQIPIYIHISQELRSLIINGHYKPDEQIPTEDEIVTKYGVSRMTARNAVTELVNEGLVYRVRGKGAFVGRVKLQRSLNKITGFHQDVLEIGLNPSSKVLDFQKRVPTDKECQRLNIRKVNKVFSIKRIRYINDTPYGFQDLVVPEYLVPDLGSLDLEHQSLYSYLEKIGKKIKNAEQHMEAVMNEQVAELLGISTSIPYFSFERVSFLKDGKPVELLHSFFRGDKFSYTINLSND